MSEPDDHVRAKPGMDPANCGIAQGAFYGTDCFVCRFLPVEGEHCFLLEMCDRCFSDDDPCGPAQVMKASFNAP